MTRAGHLGLFLLVFGVPSNAETLTGIAYRDLDLDGARGPEEPAVKGVRVLAYGSEGRILAQGVTGEDGSYQLLVSPPLETVVRVTVGALGGQLAVRPVPADALVLFGEVGELRIDLALMEIGRLEKQHRPSALRVRDQQLARGRGPDSPTRDAFLGGLPFLNVGPFVTFRCAGANGAFDFDPEIDDRLMSAPACDPQPPPGALRAFAYSALGFLPQTGERCRVFLHTEAGAGEPPAPGPNGCVLTFPR